MEQPEQSAVEAVLSEHRADRCADPAAAVMLTASGVLAMHKAYDMRTGSCYNATLLTRPESLIILRNKKAEERASLPENTRVIDCCFCGSVDAGKRELMFFGASDRRRTPESVPSDRVR